VSKQLYRLNLEKDKDVKDSRFSLYAPFLELIQTVSERKIQEGGV
jgi:hypothetical protein